MYQPPGTRIEIKVPTGQAAEVKTVFAGGEAVGPILITRAAKTVVTSR